LVDDCEDLNRSQNDRSKWTAPPTTTAGDDVQQATSHVHSVSGGDGGFQIVPLHSWLDAHGSRRSLR
jgi:hypothetical protein